MGLPEEDVGSPVNADTTSSPLPPSIICTPAVTRRDLGSVSDRVSTDPVDHANDPPSTARQGHSFSPPSPVFNSITATPQNPIISANTTRHRNLCWRKTNTSSAAVNRGSVASSTEVMPEGTYCSAQKSAP
ncbi:hypothetical protein RBB78_00180 [Tunturiibacter empetritectus]